jgi:hypothetical protein
MLRTLLALLCLLSFNSSFATTVLPLSLDHMAKNAAVIFYGRVTSNEVKIDDISQRVATFTTFEVLDAIKGVNTGTYTIKQIGGRLPGSQVVTQIYGVPRFTVNAEYVVFLPKASRLGFASPIGLSQGSYDVHTDASGNKTVHGRGMTSKPATANTTEALRTTPKPTNTTTLSNFLQNVRTLSGH